MPTRGNVRPLIEAGQLRHRIQLQQSTTLQDENGDLVSVWTTIATLWAQVSPLQLASPRSAGSSEPWAEQELQPRNVVLIVIRYAASLDIAPDMRVLHQGRQFVIRSAVNVANADHEINIVAQEMLQAEDVNV